MLSLFVAAELAHMAQEEQAIMPELWRLFSDEELLAMQQAIIAALNPGGGVPVARKLLQMDFAYDGPWARDMAMALRPLAEEIAAVPGLCWKIWTEDEAASRAGGIYLFADQNALEAYLRRHTERLAALGIRDVEVRVRDVNDALGAISRAPLAA